MAAGTVEGTVLRHCSYSKEGAVANVIDVEDMEAKVFGALLSFIYTDSLPKMEFDKVEEEGESQEALWRQHLLAAADTYDLQRLKVLSEEKLCEHIDTSSVTILTLAEQHNCYGLKEACTKAPTNLKAITAVDGLEDITRTCPSLKGAHCQVCYLILTETVAVQVEEGMTMGGLDSVAA